MIDLSPEQDQQCVGGEEEQTCTSRRRASRFWLKGFVGHPECSAVFMGLAYKGLPVKGLFEQPIGQQLKPVKLYHAWMAHEKFCVNVMIKIAEGSLICWAWLLCFSGLRNMSIRAESTFELNKAATGMPAVGSVQPQIKHPLVACNVEYV